MAISEVMKAVVFNGPYKISVQDRPIPQSMDAVMGFIFTLN